MFKIVADNAIPWLDKLFAKHGEIHRFQGREIDPEMLVDADLLLTRSTVKVDRRLLQGTAVKLVGSATAGFDHVNKNDLSDLNVKFVHAPGCNANAVAEYVVSSLACLQQQQRIQFNNKSTAAVIGCGNVGRKVNQKLETLGYQVVVYDPPLARKGGYAAKFVELDEAMRSDLVCLHTPLSRDGEDATFHLLDNKRLQQLKHGAVLLNAGRGEVIDNLALLKLLQHRSDLNVVLDVWENEPEIDWQLLNKVNLGTPHIAGHSWRGKVMGTVMLYQQICQYFDWPESSIDEVDLKMAVENQPSALNSTIYDVLSRSCDVNVDYLHLLNALRGSEPDDRGKQFDCLRKTYRPRAEFSDLAELDRSDWPLELKRGADLAGLIETA